MGILNTWYYCVCEINTKMCWLCLILCVCDDIYVKLKNLYNWSSFF